MKNPDTRVQFTKAKFQKALLELLKEKPIDSVNVRELSDRAGLNRGTFYLHYQSPRELLKEIENHFIAENMATFDSYWKEDRDTGVMARLLECIFQNQEMCRVLMGENGDPQFLNSLKELVREGILMEWQKEFPEHPRESLHFLFDFVFTGSMQLILNWIDNDQGLNPQQFTQRVERLGHYSLVAAGEFLS